MCLFVFEQKKKFVFCTCPKKIIVLYKSNISWVSVFFLFLCLTTRINEVGQKKKNVFLVRGQLVVTGSKKNGDSFSWIKFVCGCV